MKNSLRIALALAMLASLAPSAIAAPTIGAPRPPLPGGGVTAPTIGAPRPPLPGGGIN